MKKYIMILLAVFVAQVSWAQEFVKHDGVTYLVTETVSTTNTSDILTEVVKNVVIFTDSADVTKLTGTVVFPATFEQESVSGDVTTKTTYNVNGFKYWRYGSKVSLDMSNLISMTSIQISTNNSIYSPSSWYYLNYNYYQQNIGIYSDIETLVLPKSVTEITFSQTNVYGPKHIAAFEVDGENNDFTAIDGVLFSKDEKTLICYPHLKDGVAYTVPDGVTTIGDRAFYDNDKLQSITLNEGLTNIGEYSFYSNGSLYDCYLPSTLTVIGDYAFYDNTKLSSVLNNNVFPSGLLQIGGYAFQNCKLNLSNNQLELPGSLKKIGSYCFYEAFKNNSSVTVIFPSTVGLSGSQLYVEGYAFNCNIIKSLMTDPVDLESNAFNYVGTRYVPKGYKDIYEAKNGWKDYGTIKETTSLDNNPEWETVEAVKVDTILDVNNTLVSVKLSCATDGATIRYVNSSAQSELTKDPVDWYEYDTTESPELSVENGATVKAIAMKEGMNSSSISEFTLDISAMSCKQPIINAATNSTTMTMAVSDGSDIYYTTDGSTPTTTNGTKYEGAITLDGNFTYKAIAAKSGNFSSSPVEKVVNWFKCKTPTVKYEAATPDGNDVVVTLSTDEEGVTLKYNYGGGDYMDYTSPVTISTGNYFYYAATKANYNDSDYPNIYLSRENIKCAKPSIGVDQETKLLTVTAGEGYDIYYSMDGTNPSVNETYKYAGTPVAITGNYSIKAIAHKPGMFQSDQASTSISNWFACPNVLIEQVVEDGSPKMRLSLADSTSVDVSGIQIYYGINDWWSYQDGWTSYAQTYNNSPVYINSGSTIYAVAIKDGYNMSSRSSKRMDYSGYQKCATPSIELNNETKTITLTTTEKNGKIYYTTDGTTPSTASTLYTEPFTSEVNCTIMAITARDSETVDEVTTIYANSDINSRNLDDWFRLQNVKFIPVLGTTDGEYKMALQAEDGATIEYGINTYGGTAYDVVNKDTFAVSENDVVYAIAHKEGYVDSYWAEYRVTAGTYTVSAPNINVNSETREITVTTSTEGASIYYTTNGDNPTAESTKVDGVITTTKNEQYKFIAIKDGMTNSAVNSYTVNWFKVSDVVIEPFVENNVLKIRLTCADANSQIYYNINEFNNDFVDANIRYEAPFELRDGYRVYASAMKDGYNNANRTYSGYVYWNNYTCNSPTITVAADTTVMITGDVGAKFYYTLDGSDPTTNSSLYTAKFKLDKNTTIRAIATASDKLTSSISDRSYSGFYCADVVAEQIIDGGLPKMKLTCPTPGVTIRYGVGGRDYYTPENNLEYTEPVEASNGTNIYYIAQKENFNNSNWGSKNIDYSGLVQCSQPSISLDNENKTISMSTSEENGKIYYTLDGSTPTTADSLYKAPFTSDVNCTVKAITARDTMTVDGTLVTYVNSYASEVNLDNWFRLERVKFVPIVGSAEGLYRLALESEEGATIEYGINTYGGTIYSDTIDVSAGTWIYAIARKEGKPESYWSEFYISNDNYTVQIPTINANSETHVLTVNSGTEGADIYYSKGNTVPTSESTKLDGNEITVSRNDTLNFVAIKKGMYDSRVNSYTVRWFQVPSVTITPYAENNKMKVRLTCEDSDVEIYYGIGDFNNDNVKANALYEGPFEVQSGNYVYASAVKDGFTNASRTSSYLQSSDYTCTTPTITVAADTTVTISGGEGETLYYTLDGSEPTTSSTKFTSKFKLSKNATIKAIAASSGKLNSSVRERSYSGFRVNSVTITPFVENNKLMVKLETTTPGATIYYALNNRNSTITSNIAYNAPFEISEVNNGAYIYANAIKDGFNEAGWTNHDWLYISNYTTSEPSVTLEADTTIVLSADANATIYYTLDGSTPSTTSTKYTAKFKLDRNVNLRAIAVEDGKISSSVRQYDYSNFRVANPTFSLEGTTLTIMSETPNAVIYYAFGDDAVADENANKYTGPFALPDNQVVKAIATREGWNNSNARNYTPDNVVQCPKPIVPNDGYNGHTMTLTTIDKATIYYTTDGTIPSRNVTDSRWDNSLGRWVYTYSYTGNEYTEPISISQTCTVIAKAFHPYMVESDTIRYSVDSYTSETGATTIKAGGLATSMVWSSPETIKEFKIAGPVNSADINYIKENMVSLEKLDLSAAKAEDGIIPDNAFAGLPLLSFSSPSDVKTVGSKIFSGCKELAAVEWNSETKIPEDAFDNDANPNLLLYVVGRSDAPNNVRNIIVNNTATNIYLNDGENNNFYCPKRFYAENITYIHAFTLESGNDSGWETLALPFDCDKYVHESKGELLPFASYNEQQNKGNYKPFWLRELTDIGFQDVKQMEANKPYLICMPNNSTYATRYRLGGNVTFSASNKWIPATAPQSLTKGMKSMTANFLNNSDTDDYYLLNTEATDEYKAGSVFLKNTGRALRPFEAYVTSQVAATRAISLSRGFSDDPDGDEDTTPIETVNQQTTGKMVKVYSLSGVLVKEAAEEDALKGLAKGVYIVNGKSMVVK